MYRLFNRSTSLVRLSCMLIMVAHARTATGSCASPANPIEAENCLAGNPASQWDISGAGDSTIQGFATDISVNAARRSRSRSTPTPPAITSTSTAWAITGERRPQSRHRDAFGHAAAEPAGLPAPTRTGLYRLRQLGGLGFLGGARHRRVRDLFRARDPHDTRARATSSSSCANDASTSDILFQTSDTTWQAYNDLRRRQPLHRRTRAAGEARYKVSYNRPFHTGCTSSIRGSSTPNIRWCGGWRPTATTSATSPASTPIASAP